MKSLSPLYNAPIPNQQPLIADTTNPEYPRLFYNTPPTADTTNPEYPRLFYNTPIPNQQPLIADTTNPEYPRLFIMQKHIDKYAK